MLYKDEKKSKKESETTTSFTVKSYMLSALECRSTMSPHPLSMNSTSIIEWHYTVELVFTRGLAGL